MDKLYPIQNNLGQKPYTDHLGEKSVVLVKQIIELCKESGLNYKEINEALYTADRVQLHRILNNKTV